MFCCVSFCCFCIFEHTLAQQLPSGLIHFYILLSLILKWHKNTPKQTVSKDTSGSRQKEPTCCSKACVQAVAPFSSSLSAEAGSCARWQPALLCWSKHKLLLSPGDRRQHRSVASPFPRQSALGTWTPSSRQGEWYDYFGAIAPSSASWHTSGASETSTFFSHSSATRTQTHTHTRTAVLLPVRYAQQRTVTKRPFQVRLFLNFIFLNVAVNATPLSEPSGVYVRSHSGSSAFWQPAVDPVRQCGLMERLEFLSWSSLSLCFFFFSFPRLAYLFCVCDVCVHHSEDDVFSAWRSVAVWLSMWAALEPVSTCRWAEAVVLLRLWVDLVRLFTRVFSSVFRFWTLVECSVGCMDSCFFFKCSNHWTSLIYKGGGLSVSWSEVRGQSTDQDPWCRGDEPLCQVWPLSNQTAGVRWAQTPSGLCSTDH